MKLQSEKIQSFLRLPDPAVRAVLVYGSDNGQVCEVLEALTRAIVANSKDPFRVSNLTASEVRTDPALLPDTVTTLTITGGRRVVRIGEADDSIANLLRAFLGTPGGDGDALVVVAAGNLGKESNLRQLFESSSTSVLAMPCYPDDHQTLTVLIHETLQQFGLRGEEAAVAYMVERLGGDRLQNRRELENLALYACSHGNTVTLADSMACIGDSTEPSLQSLAMAVADGNTVLTDRLYARLILEGMTPVRVLRALANHFRRLHMATVIMAAHHCRAEQAMATLKPPPFFKMKDRFKAQLLAWPERQLVEGLDLLMMAEIDCKTTGGHSESICGWTLLQLLQRGAAFRNERIVR